MISSHWDTSHLIELVMKDSLSSNQIFNTNCDILSSFMREFKEDKNKMIFTSLADKLRVPDLKSKIQCGTRFARYNLDFFKSGFRDVFVYYAFLKEKEKAALTIGDNRELDIVRKKLNKLTDSKSWIRLIGYYQLFNLISKFSVTVQASSSFATSAVVQFEKCLAKLKDLSYSWVWADETLISDVGTPLALMEKVRDQTFCPIVGKQAKMIKANKINARLMYRKKIFCNDIENSDDSDEELLEWDDIVVKEVPLEKYSIIEENKVMKELEKISNSLIENFELRYRRDSIVDNAMDTFGDFSWLKQESQVHDEFENDSLIDEIEDRSYPVAYQEMHDLIMLIPIEKRNHFMDKMDKVTNGYLSFSKFVTSRDYKVDDLETSYKDFCISTEGYEDLVPFKILFERIQIRSYSEAFCESVGSIMKRHKQAGRQLENANYAKEIYLYVNLPPL